MRGFESIVWGSLFSANLWRGILLQVGFVLEGQYAERGILAGFVLEGQYAERGTLAYAATLSDMQAAMSDPIALWSDPALSKV